jgi:hypothetical protein
MGWQNQTIPMEEGFSSAWLAKHPFEHSIWYLYYEDKFREWNRNWEMLVIFQAKVTQQ